MTVQNWIALNVAVILGLALLVGTVAGIATSRDRNSSRGEGFLAFAGAAFATGWITFALSTSVWVVVIVLHFVLKFW